ncbi:MAG: hypothetical protein M1828_004005 [Chrysothrix sp. TS-e1954]|nr:MAG: hypothetical protein M1828_004005 [Chrysothrix sp. TS-e1954]
MSSNRLRRIAKEIEDTRSDTLSKVNLEPANGGDDLTALEGSFEGPPDTPYEGGKYFVDIRIPNDYPFRPPNMRFRTKIWHPNVSSQTGAICLDTLSTNWSPVLTIKSAMISLQGLLASPEPKDPQDAEVAGMLLKNPKEFEHIAREWAMQYAGAPSKEAAEGSGGMTADQLMKKAEEAKKKQNEQKPNVYRGFNSDLIGRFTQMGFDVESVVNAFEYVGIDRNGGEDYELEEEYMGDITARLFGEP